MFFSLEQALMIFLELSDLQTHPWCFAILLTSDSHTLFDSQSLTTHQAEVEGCLSFHRPQAYDLSSKHDLWNDWCGFELTQSVSPRTQQLTNPKSLLPVHPRQLQFLIPLPLLLPLLCLCATSRLISKQCHFAKKKKKKKTGKRKRKG